MIPHVWLLANNSTGTVPLANQIIGIAIWVGVAILTIALLILMRTRWGQVQPLSKCVVLSVFAHLLLILFAYTTKLLEPVAPLGQDDAIQLAFVTDEPPREGEKKVEPTPWEEFLPGESPEPDAEPTARLTVEPEPIARTEEDNTWAGPTNALPQETVPIDEPTRAIEQHQIPTPRRPEPAVTQAVSIEQPAKPQRRAAAPVTMPLPAGPRRIETPPVVQRTATPSSETQLPTEVFDMGSRMQQLVDVAVGTEPADALAGPVDQVAESENRGSASYDSSGITHPPTQDRSSESTNMVALPTSAPKVKQVMTPAPLLIEQSVMARPRRLGDGQPLPEPYRLRSIPQRKEVAVGLGGSAEAAAAVEAALAWLAAQQEQDGRWDASRWGSGIEHKVAGHNREGAGTQADTGITALAVLAFLANGQTHLEGPYRKNVQRGLEFLLRSQGADGNLAGAARLYARMYCHGMALLALSESLAMTGDVRIRPYVEKGVAYTVNAQHPTTGGWRYQPADQGDMSQFGWQVMALKSASMAGIAIPQQTREGMLHFLQRCEQGRHGGLCGYRPSAPASRPMTAEALVCRYFLDLAPGDELVTEATGFLQGELPQAGSPNLYYWYYGTMAMFQVQGEAWQQWNGAMQRQLLRLQRTDGHLAGSWDPDTVWGAYGGRAYSTAMAALCLEVYYRYLPLTAVP